MQVARAGHCALSVEDDKIIVFGGCVSDEDYDSYSLSIECFDGHIWSKKANMRQRRFGFVCKLYLTLIANSVLFCFNTLSPHIDCLHEEF